MKPIAGRKFFRTAARTIVSLAALMSLTPVACNSDNSTGSSTGYDRLTWDRAEHVYGDSSHYITVTDLWGPEGSSIDHIIPGKYVAKGTYNVEGSSFSTGVISLDFLGQISTVENDRIADNQTFTVPEGQIAGSYTIIREFFRLVSGSGNPMVDFRVDNTIKDRVTLY